MNIRRWLFLVLVILSMKIHSAIMKTNIKAISVHILLTMKMWLTIFMQDVMRFWFHQDLNHVDLHSL